MAILLKRLRPYENENLLSLCIRLATDNYCEPRNLFRLEKGKNFYDIDFEKRRDCTQQLSELTGFSERDILSLTTQRFRKLLAVSDNMTQKDRMRYLERKAKICPSCIREQNYYRLGWNLRVNNICLKHKKYLINKCSNCGKDIMRSIQFYGFCKCGASVMEMESAEVLDLRALDMQSVIESRLVEREKNDYYEVGSPINELPSGFFFKLLVVFTEIIARFPTKSFAVCLKRDQRLLSEGNKKLLLKKLEPKMISDLYVIASEVLINWPFNLCCYLNEFKEEYPYKSYDAGITKDFGRLFRILKSELNDPVYSFLWQQVINYLYQDTQRYDIGAINRLVEERGLVDDKQYITRNEVLRELAVTSDYFNKLVDLSEIEYIQVNTDKRIKHVISYDEVAAIKKTDRIYGSNITKYKVAEELKVSVKIIDQLIDSKLLETCVGINDARFKDIVITGDSYSKFKKFFLYSRGCNLKSSANSELVSIGSTIRGLTRHKYNYGRILSLMKQGILQFQIKDEGKGLNNIYLAKADVGELLNKARRKTIHILGYSLPEVKDILHTPVSTIKSWINLGLIKATPVMQNSKPSFRIKEENIVKFKKTYMFVSEAAEEFSIPKTTMNGWINRELIPIKSGPKVDGTLKHVFKREDLVKVLKEMKYYKVEYTNNM